MRLINIHKYRYDRCGAGFTVTHVLSDSGVENNFLISIMGKFKDTVYILDFIVFPRIEDYIKL